MLFEPEAEDDELVEASAEVEVIVGAAEEDQVEVVGGAVEDEVEGVVAGAEVLDGVQVEDGVLLVHADVAAVLLIEAGVVDGVDDDQGEVVLLDQDDTGAEVKDEDFAFLHELCDAPSADCIRQSAQ